MDFAQGIQEMEHIYSGLGHPNPLKAKKKA